VESAGLLVCVVGIVMSLAVTQLWIYACDHWLYKGFRRAEEQGRRHMVAWMSFSMFMECAYYFTHPNKTKDARLDKEIQDAAGVFEEQTSMHEDGNFYLDFVADTGDGFDPTFAVATLLAKEKLIVREVSRDGSETSVELPRATTVIHGGDICYPFPDDERFMTRFIQPYTWAFPARCADEQPRRMYFVAGNHEYMDGLGSFRKNILQRSSIGGWKTPQKGSYFAIKLPASWWMFCIDLGPEPEDINPEQQAFFKNIKRETEDKVILVYHVPDWIKAAGMGFEGHLAGIAAFRKSIGDDVVKLVLAGDIHNYRRMEVQTASYKQEKPQCPTNCFLSSAQTFIVAGNGGAFSHGTNFPNVESVYLKDEGKLLVTKTTYPTPQVSETIWQQRWRSMFFDTTNSYYNRILGTVYMLMFATNIPVSVAAPHRVTFSPTNMLLWGAIIWMTITHYIMASATHCIDKRRAKVLVIVLVSLHTGAHLAFAFLCRFVITTIVWGLLGDVLAQIPSSFNVLVAYTTTLNLATFVAGVTIAPVITAFYFDMSLRWADYHWNEAVSTIHDIDHKGFCRIVIRPNGALDIYSIGIDKTPTCWYKSQSSPADPAVWKPHNPINYHLVERVSI